MTDSLPVKKQSLAAKAQYYSFLLLFFFLPFSKRLIPPLILIWAIAFMSSGDIKHKISTFFKSAMSLLMVAFYLLHAVGMLYTSDTQAGLFDLEVKFSMLLFPVLIFGSEEFIRKNLDKALACFVITNFISAFLCFYYASYRVIFENYFRFATYAEFSIFLHPTYASMYALLAICIIIHFFLSGKLSNSYSDISSVTLKSIAVFMILFFLTSIYFYSSRAGLIALIAVAAVALIFIYRFVQSKIVRLILPVLSVLIVLGFLKFNSRFQELLPFLHSDKSISYQTRDNAEIRFIMIKETIESIKKNLLIGVGTGDVKSELINKYRTKHFDAAVEENLNVHNQFLETQLGLGILGGLLLLIIVFMPLVHGIRKRDILLIAFAFIIIVNFMFESMLNVQAGVVFYSLFGCLLIVNTREESQT